LPHGATRLLAALADDLDGEIGLFATHVTSSYPALTPECPSAHYFEREIFEQFEIEPTGHPWLKPVLSRSAARRSAKSISLGSPVRRSTRSRSGRCMRA